MALREWLSRFRSRSGPEGELGGGLQGGYAVITEKEKAEVGAPALGVAYQTGMSLCEMSREFPSKCNQRELVRCFGWIQLCARYFFCLDSLDNVCTCDLAGDFLCKIVADGDFDFTFK